MKPNFLFLLPDQHRADWLGSNAALPLRTPNLDRLAEQGVSFSRAYTPSPLCAPARACLASGRSYARCPVKHNGHDFPLETPTYYRALRDAGYAVAGVGKFDLHRKTLDWGLDGSRLLREWGFTEGIDNEGKLDGSTSYAAAGAPTGPYLAFLARRGLADAYVAEHRDRRLRQDAYTTELPDDAYCDNWVAANGMELLRRFAPGRPWHLVVNFTGPHNPMEVTASMAGRWSGVRFPPPCGDGAPEDGRTAEDHQRARRNYAAMIENIDRHAGRFMDLVAERGEIDRTVIVYSSDHGEMLGDHGRWGKSVWHEPSVRIPLLIRAPGALEGRSLPCLVSLHDLGATFLDYAGEPPLPDMEARSLRPVLEGRTSTHREVVSAALDTARGSWRAAIDARHKLVELESGEVLLYDLAEDPTESVNRAAGLPEVLERLRRALEHTRGESGPGR